jgi:Flp pilus assembly pilin Flp
MYAALRGFQRRSEGAHLVEYALLAGVIAVGAIAVLTDLRGAITALIEPVIDALAALP